MAGGELGALIGGAAVEEIKDRTTTIGDILKANGCPDGPGAIKLKGRTITVPSVRKFWIAVARAENSTADVKKVNRKNGDGSTDTGIMQINSIHGISEEQLKDPNINVSTAKRLSNNWTDASPWVTANTGKYQRYMTGDNDIPLKNYSGSGTSLSDIASIPGDAVSAAGDVVDGLGTIANAIEDVVNALFNPSTYLRFGKGLLGLIFILLGLLALYGAYSKGGSKPKIPVAPKVPVPK